MQGQKRKGSRVGEEAGIFGFGSSFFLGSVMTTESMDFKPRMPIFADAGRLANARISCGERERSLLTTYWSEST